MTLLERLNRWKEAGAITPVQFGTLDSIVRKHRFSLYVELHALLYVGVLAIVAGVLWTVQAHFSDLGDIAILLVLTTILAGCVGYCLSRADPYSSAELASPTAAFDYILYLGCAIFGIELGYLESRFGLLGEAWDLHLLVSAAVFFTAAYRFDNRLVLSLALSTLAGWFGVKLTRFGLESDDLLRIYGIAYGVTVAGIAAGVHRLGIKKHFAETYFHVAALALFVSLLSGVGEDDTGLLYLAGVLLLGGIAVVSGIRYHRFAFVAYGVVFPYLGVSLKVLEQVDGEAGLAYGVVSASAMVVLMIYAARRFGRHE